MRDTPRPSFGLSFDVRSVRMIGQLEPDFIRGLLSKNMRDYPLSALKRWLLTGCRLSFYCKPDFIAYKTADLPIGRITGKRRRGMPVLGWTVRSYETQDGQKRYRTEVVCDFVAQTMGSEHQQAAPAPRASAPQPKPAAPGTGFDSMGSSTDEEIPF